jgi:uncharacterized membrane protein (Fun14 family)
MLAFFSGAIIALITIWTRSNLLRVAAFLIGIIPIFYVLFAQIPSPSFNVTVEQTVDRITNLLNVFIDIVLPYLIGAALSNAGSQFIFGISRNFK